MFLPSVHNNAPFTHILTDKVSVVQEKGLYSDEVVFLIRRIASLHAIVLQFQQYQA